MSDLGIKRWRNKTTPGATIDDYALNEVNLNKMVDDLERRITVLTELYEGFIISGGVVVPTAVPFQVSMAELVGYINGVRVFLEQPYLSTFLANSDIYLRWDTSLATTTTGYVRVYLGSNGFTPPVIAFTEASLVKVVTDATTVVSIVDMTNRILKLKLPVLVGNFATSTGTSDALVATLSQPVSPLGDGFEVNVRANGTNTTLTPTLQVSGGATLPIRIKSNVGLILPQPQDIQSNIVYRFIYDINLHLFVLTNPSVSFVNAGAINNFTTRQIVNYDNANSYANSGLELRSAAGDVHLGFNCPGVSASSLRHLRGSAGLSVRNSANALTNFEIGTLTAGIVPLDRIIRTQVGATGGGSVNMVAGVAGTILSLVVGTVNAGDLIEVTTSTVITLAAGTNAILLWCQQSAGTATTIIGNSQSQSNVELTPYTGAFSQSITWRTLFRVTGIGTCTLIMRGLHIGAGTAVAQGPFRDIHAIVYRNS